jgi:hypothetical protein
MITTYPTIAFTVRGHIEWGTGKRYESAKQFNADVQGVISIRYRTGVLPEQRIDYYDHRAKRTRYLYIISISETPFHELLIPFREQLD